MKLTVVGCSPAWPNPGSAHSGYLVTSDGRRVLLDCGPGVLARLRETEPWPTIDAIVISHLHLDHCGDLVPWLWGHVLGPAIGTHGPELHVPPAGLARISTFAPLGRFLQVFDVHEYADGVPFDGRRPSRSRARAVAHYGEPSFGFRVEHDRPSPRLLRRHGADAGAGRASLATPMCSSARRRCSHPKATRTVT